MRKTIVKTLLCGMLIISLTGCGGIQNTVENSTTKEQAKAETTDTEISFSESEPAKVIPSVYPHNCTNDCFYTADEMYIVQCDLDGNELQKFEMPCVDGKNKDEAIQQLYVTDEEILYTVYCDDGMRMLYADKEVVAFTPPMDKTYYEYDRVNKKPIPVSSGDNDEYYYTLPSGKNSVLVSEEEIRKTEPDLTYISKLFADGNSLYAYEDTRKKAYFLIRISEDTDGKVEVAPEKELNQIWDSVKDKHGYPDVVDIIGGRCYYEIYYEDQEEDDEDDVITKRFVFDLSSKESKQVKKSDPEYYVWIKDAAEE